MRRFYWVLEGRLAGCSRPGAHRGTNGSGADQSAWLDEDLQWLQQQGIGSLLSMTETPLSPAALSRYDLGYCHIPVPDLTAPHPGQLHEALGFIDRELSSGRAVAVHCLEGQGRTGVILAAYLVRGGETPDRAIAHLRELCPHAVEMPEQEHALHLYHERRDWIL